MLKISVTILGFAVFSAFILSSSEASAALPTVYSGEDLRVPNQTVSKKASDTRKGMVLVFLSAKCPCSAGHEGTLSALAQEFTPLGFQFVGVHSNRDESLANARAHFQSANLSFPVIEDGSDQEAVLATAFGALKTPHVFLLSPSGELLFSGGVDDSKDPNRAKQHYLRDALVSVSKGESPKVKETRTLGCVIHKQAED